MVRKKANQNVASSKYDEINIKILLLEIFVIAIVAGFYYQSWWVFGSVILGLFIALNFKVLAIILNISFSIGWGFIGFVLGTYTNNYIASIVLAILGLAAGLFFHRSAIKWRK